MYSAGIGHGNPEFDYFMWDRNEQVKLSKLDLRVFVDCSLNFDSHIVSIAKNRKETKWLVFCWEHLIT